MTETILPKNRIRHKPQVAGTASAPLHPWRRLSAPTRRHHTTGRDLPHARPVRRWARHGRNGSCRKQISLIVLHLNDWPRGWQLKANFWRQQASFRNRPVAPRPAA